MVGSAEAKTKTKKDAKRAVPAEKLRGEEMKPDNPLAAVEDGSQPGRSSPKKGNRRLPEAARNCGRRESELAGNGASVPVDTLSEPYVPHAGEDVASPPPKEMFKIPGTRKWTHSRIKALLDRACEAGVRGMDGTPESLSEQRFVKSANAWVGATTGLESGVRPRFVPMCGPKPRCDVDSCQFRFVDWDLPKDCTLSFDENRKDAGLEFRLGDMQRLGIPDHSAFANISRSLRQWQVFSLQQLRGSTFLAVAVELLLKNIHDSLRGTECYEALLPAIEDVADLTSLQCNRAAVSAHAVCRESRRAITDTVYLPREVRLRYLDAPFSTTLFEDPAPGAVGQGSEGARRGRGRSSSRSLPTGRDGRDARTLGSSSREEDEGRRDRRCSRSRSRSPLRHGSRRRRSSRSGSRGSSRVWNSSPKQRWKSSGSPDQGAGRRRDDFERQGERFAVNSETDSGRRHNSERIRRDSNGRSNNISRSGSPEIKPGRRGEDPERQGDRFNINGGMHSDRRRNSGPSGRDFNRSPNKISRPGSPEIEPGRRGDDTERRGDRFNLNGGMHSDRRRDSGPSGRDFNRSPNKISGRGSPEREPGRRGDDTERRGDRFNLNGGMHSDRRRNSGPSGRDFNSSPNKIPRAGSPEIKPGLHGEDLERQGDGSNINRRMYSDRRHNSGPSARDSNGSPNKIPGARSPDLNQGEDRERQGDQFDVNGRRYSDHRHNSRLSGRDSSGSPNKIPRAGSPEIQQGLHGEDLGREGDGFNINRRMSSDRRNNSGRSGRDSSGSPNTIPRVGSPELEQGRRQEDGVRTADQFHGNDRDADQSRARGGQDFDGCPRRRNFSRDRNRRDDDGGGEWRPWNPDGAAARFRNFENPTFGQSKPGRHFESSDDDDEDEDGVRRVLGKVMDEVAKRVGNDGRESRRQVRDEGGGGGPD